MHVSVPIVSTCPICESPRCTLHLDGVDEELTLASIGSSRTKLSHGRILRCRDCAFAFRRYRPTGEKLASLYRDADIEVYERELQYRLRTARFCRRMVTQVCPEPGAILEVGCASGVFLKAMAEIGWEIHGVEPSARQFELARKALGAGAALYNRTLESVGLHQAFDAIAFWDVLEHVPEPVSFLTLCASLLKPGGRAFFTVPNMDSWPARLMGKRWPLLLAEHLNHFNPASLRICSKRAGLRLESVNWRTVHFSADYVFYRLGQHGFPGMNTLRKALVPFGLARLDLPVYMGDMVCVARRD